MYVGLTLGDQIIFLSSDIKIWPSELNNHRICFFIDDYIAYKKVHEIIPPNCQQDETGSGLNRIAKNIRNKIVDLDQIVFSGRFHRSWLASSFAENNSYRSDFFLNMCRAIYLVQEASPKGPTVVIVNNYHIGETLRQICCSNEINALWFMNQKSNRFKKILKIAKSGLSGIFYALKYKKLYAHKDLGLSRNSRVLFLTWAGQNQFSSTQETSQSMYFGELPAWVRDTGSSITWLANPTNWLGDPSKIAANIQSAKDSVIPLPALMNYRTILKAIGWWLIFPASIKKSIEVNGVDVSPLIKMTMREELSIPQIIQASLMSDVAKLLRAAKFNPEVLIYTYENQPWEKIMLQSFRQEFPDLSIIANQTAPFAEMYLSVFPSKHQWLDDNTPDKLIVIGEDFKNHLLQLNAPPDRVVVGGSFRISNHLGGLKKFKPLGSRKKILVSCPMEKIDTLELACKSVEAVQYINGYDLLINFHPACGVQFVEELTTQIKNTYDCSNVQFSENKATELFSQIDLLLYSSTGTVFEALLAGIQCLYVGPITRIDMGKLPSNATSAIREVTDIRAKILDLIEDQKTAETSYNLLISEVLSCISPIDKNMWVNLIGNKIEPPR